MVERERREGSLSRSETMGATERMLDQVFNLKFLSKQLVRQAKKCEKDRKAERNKVKKAIEKQNVESARIYAQNAIRKQTEELNYLKLASRLDAVVSRLETQAKMQMVNKNMAGIVKALERSLNANNLTQMSMTMENFERQFENMDVQSAAMEQSLGSTTAMSTPQADVDSLLSEVADEHGLELGSMLPAPEAAAIQTEAATSQKETGDDLTRRLNELKAGR